jgi:hypothetical protein
MSKSRKEGHATLKVSFPDDQLPVLKATCHAHGTSMSDFARTAIQAALEAPASASPAPSPLPTGPAVFSGAVEAAARATAGIPRVQLEALTAAVVNHLYSRA